MAWSLRPGISFCAVAERLVLLDIVADRYLALRPQAEAALFHRAAGLPMTTDDHRALQALARSGVLVETNREMLNSCARPPAPTGSVLDRADAVNWRRAAVLGAWHIAKAERSLKRAGLGAALKRFDSAKRRTDGRAMSSDTVAAVGCAHERLTLLAGGLDRCLPRSLALASHLAGLGGQPRLVIGVQIEPFRAHCWVQHGALLVNERIETVDSYTPILVI